MGYKTITEIKGVVSKLEKDNSSLTLIVNEGIYKRKFKWPEVPENEFDMMMVQIGLLNQEIEYKEIHFVDEPNAMAPSNQYYVYNINVLSGPLKDINYRFLRNTKV